jgi:hypothetical protein
MINVAALICIMVLPTNQDYKLSSKYWTLVVGS